MKRLFILLATLVAISMTTGCHKESAENANRERDITYSVVWNKSQSQYKDGPATVHLTTESEYQSLLDSFCDFAEDGAEVTFYNALKQRGTKTTCTKDVVTFSTSSREEMKRWMAQMEDAGKTVTVTFDRETGTWTGMAYATPPQQMQGGVATYVNAGFDGWHGQFNVIVTIDSMNHVAYVNHDYGSNHWYHIPCGRFDNIREENGNLILAEYEAYSEPLIFDTLLLKPLGGDTLLLEYIYHGCCYADHVHACVLVPAPRGLETWYSEQMEGIIMNIMPNYIETEPAICLAQFCAPHVYYPMDLSISPMPQTGFCEMQRFYTSIPGIDWELSLRYTYNNDSTFFVIDSLGLSGHPLRSFTHDAMPIVIHLLNQSANGMRLDFYKIN